MAARDDNNGLRVDIIDVGQGDSILLEGPTGETMLIDSGDYRDRGKQVLEYLDERGIDVLDCLVATHDDADHIGGHAAIVEEFGPDGIGAVYGPKKEGVNTKNAQTWLRYKDALEENDYDITELEEGDPIDFDTIAVDVHNPSPEISSKKTKSE